MRIENNNNSLISQAKAFLILAAIFFSFVIPAKAQQEGPAAVSSNGVTISFQNQGGDAKSSNGATISFQNAGDASSGASSGVSIAFGSRANESFYYGNSPNSGTFADPVNTATGNFTFDKTDMTVAGRGFGFEFKRFYNSQDAKTGMLGYGWTHSYNLTLTENTTDNTATVRYEDGHEEIYNRSGNNFAPRFSGIYNKLVKNADNSFTVTRKDRRKYNFDTNGKLASIIDRNGNAATLVYDGGGKLITVNIASGRQVNFSYNAQNYLEQISDTLTPAPRTVSYEYDVNGNLITVTDLNGNPTRFTYDADHQMLTATDPRNNIFVTNVYDAARRVVSYQTDAKGNRTDFTYNTATGKTTIKDAANNLAYDYHDVRSRLIRREDRLGKSFTYTYDENNNRLSVTDKNGNPTLYEYDANGNVKKQTDAFGKTVQIVYDPNDNPTSRTDELGNTTTFEYDANGNLTKTTEPLNKITEFTYDPFGQLKTVKDALNRTMTNNYDAFGNLISTVDALTNATVYAYDTIGRRTSTTDARNKTTAFAYDKIGNLLNITDPMTGTITYEYDANNNRTKITDARDEITRFEYDENNLLEKMIDAKSGETEYFYDNLDRRTSVKDARNNTTNFEYDKEGRLTKITDPLTNATRFEYDANGNRTKTIDAKTNPTRFFYDALNRLIRTTDALGNQTDSTFDALGRLTRTTDAKGNATRYFYDALGRLTKVTDAGNKDTEYTYDLVGNRLTVKNPNTNTTVFTYDELNRLETQTNALNKTYTFTYDEVGNLKRRQTPNNHLIDYTYDGNNRLTRIDYPNSTFVSFVYDANGNRTQMTDSIGNSVYVYDELNRLTNYTDAYGKTIGYEYDANGNRTALIYPDGKRVNYVFDAANRLTSATDWGSRTTSYGYDAASLLSSSTNANGSLVNYSYDNAGRLISMSNRKADLSVISSYAFTLDAVGNRSNVNQTEPIAAGANLSDKTYTYNTANQIQTAGATVFTSDDNGNLKTQTTGGVTTNFNYDFEDRLTSASGGTASAQYVYNGLGQRLARTTNGATTRFVLDPTSRLPRILAETDNAGNIKNYYTHGLGLIAKITSTGEAFQYHFDARGSVNAMTNSSQAIVNRYAYDSFGTTTAVAEQTTNPFRYIGQFGVTAEPFDLQFAARRFYNPSLGRFLTKDAAEPLSSNPQTLNEYVYSLNNPIVLIDPSGLSGEQDGGARFELQRTSDKYNSGLLEYDGFFYNITGFADNQQLVNGANSYVNFVGRFNNAFEKAIFVDTKNFLGCGLSTGQANNACQKSIDPTNQYPELSKFLAATQKDIGSVLSNLNPFAKIYNGAFGEIVDYSQSRREGFTRKQSVARVLESKLVDRALNIPTTTINYFSERFFKIDITHPFSSTLWR